MQIKQDNNTSNPIEKYSYFVSSIYTTVASQFLKIVQEVSEEYLNSAKKAAVAQPDNLYPVVMSNNYFSDARLAGFTEYVAQTAWHILDSQGYAMDDLSTYFTEMWTQEHNKMSDMEQHVHANSQVVGFYFLETPENCSKLLIYDPRPGRVQTNLPQKNGNDLTDGSTVVNFTPKVGSLMFLPSWLPHSFTRNAADSSIKFVHFNIGVQQNPSRSSCSPVEII